MSNHGNITPFPVTEKRSICDTPLGTEFDIVDSTRGPITVRLVQLDMAAGFTLGAGRIMVGTTQAGAPDFQVEPCTAATERAGGISVCTESLVDDDYFFVQVDGLMSIYMGDDGTDAALGTTVMTCDDDATLGAGAAAARTMATAVYLDIGLTLEIQAGTGELVLVDPFRKLYG